MLYRSLSGDTHHSEEHYSEYDLDIDYHGSA